jgi:hypothetical protein
MGPRETSAEMGLSGCITQFWDGKSGPREMSVEMGLCGHITLFCDFKVPKAQLTPT